jgi:hypothetical protein
MACYWKFVSHHMNNKCSLHAVDSSWQLCISAQAVGTTCSFKLPSHCKTCSPAPFLKLIYRQDGNQANALSFRPLCSVLAAHVLYVSLTTEKTRKGNNCLSREYRVIVLHSRFLCLTLSHSLSPCFLFFSSRFPAICFPTSFPSLSPQRISLGRDFNFS